MKGLITVIILILLIIGGVMIFGSSDTTENDSMMMEDHNEGAMMEGDSMEKEGEAMMMEEKKEEGNAIMKDDSAMMESAGTYEAYSADKVANAKGKIVLFFKADWCPTCVALDKSINSSLKNIPGDVTILEVDYDNSADLKKKYGVTTQHTLVQVDAQGNMVTSWRGGFDLDSIIKNLK
jgi:thiol-disulfide isomerase/thioredoxin